ncbi:hypothetical protein D3C83_319710 [compost metagenome]
MATLMLPNARSASACAMMRLRAWSDISGFANGVKKVVPNMPEAATCWRTLVLLKLMRV